MTQDAFFFGAHCPDCFATMQQLLAQFEADVQAGKFDADGYTPADRKQQRKKAVA